MEIPIHVHASPNPIEANELRPFLEKIIDKKVNHIALNIFEQFVHVLCACFYNAYSNRLAYRISLLNKDREEKSVSPSEQNQEEKLDEQAPELEQVAEKIHYFADGAPLFDRTATQRIAIVQHRLFNLLEQKEVLGEDQIHIDGKPVYFSSNPKHVMLFGKNHGTDHVIVTDVKECPELVIIYEREDSSRNAQLKAWCVNTTQPTQKILMGGLIPIGKPQDIFIARSIAPQPAHPAIIQSFP